MQRITSLALALALALVLLMSSSSTSRRVQHRPHAWAPRFTGHVAAAAAAAAAALSTTYFVPVLPAFAAEELTSRQQVIRETENFLFNSKLLEAVRKMDQLEADEAVAMQTNKAILLVPVVDILKDIEAVSGLLKAGTETDLRAALGRVTSPKFETKTFKKTFNRYSDNIFISDPKRTNIYLAGGAMPTSLQTQQYLLRNQALTSVGNVRDDVKLMLDDVAAGRPVAAQDVADAVDDCREALDALNGYLQLADPEDVTLANKVVASSR